ncbi:MAG: hypothetical protein AB8F94_16290 [Saprospiraceae bacterium]
MRNGYLDTQILLNKDDLQVSLGKSISGQIIFIPKIDLSVQELGYRTIIVTTNKHFAREIPLHKEVFFRNKKMKKGSTYKYDITFEPDFPSTLISEDLEIDCYVQSIVNLQTDSYLQVRNDFLNKKKLTVDTNTNRLLWYKRKFAINHSKVNYVIEEENHDLGDTNYRPWIYFLLGSIFTFIFISIFGSIYKFQIVGVSLSCLFLIFIAPQLYKEHILNSIEVVVKQHGKSQFGIFLNLTQTWNRIRSVKVGYGVFAENLTSSESGEFVYNYDLHKSKIKTREKYNIQKNTDEILDFPEITYDFIFDFPKENIPPTFNHSYLKTYWEFKVTVFYIFWLKSEFTKKIKVSKEKITKSKLNKKDQ